MLQIITKPEDLDFWQLMDVYEQSNHGQQGHPAGAALRLQHEQDFYAYVRQFLRQPDTLYAVLLWQDRYVSAVRAEPWQDGWLLTGLETAPAYRCRGYASRLLMLLLEQMNKQGKSPVYSHVAKKNIASISVHRKCGFYQILDHAVFTDGSVSQSAYTLSKK